LLKKETRTLGLSVTVVRNDEMFVVGTVFRGSSWLDGILTCWLKPETISPLLKISASIIASKQYSQLNGVVLSKRTHLFKDAANIAELSRIVKLPVMSIIGRKNSTRKTSNLRLGLHYYVVEVNSELVHVLAIGKSQEETRELFVLSSAAKSCVPEAARVAELISEQVRLKWNSLREP
jgi:endonuclease V-like protein UPF0215 family